MNPKRLERSAPDGFTLIELLVVIAIVVLLLLLLTPALSGVRETARTMICGANLRQIHVASMAFASDNRGRFPGSGLRQRPGVSTSSISWVNILNEHHMEPNIQRIGETMTKGAIYCPSMQKYPPVQPRYPRAYMYNNDATGGNSPSGAPPDHPGPYGWTVPTEQVKQICEDADFLRLGATVSMAPNPNAMFLVIENERSADTVSSSSTGDGKITVGTNPEYPPFAGPSGVFAFRHRMTANFLFFDGHTERLTPNDEINNRRRLSFVK